MNYITTISGLIVLNDRSSFRFDEFIVEAQEGVVYVGGDGDLSWSLLPSNTFVLGVKYDTTEDLMTAIAELSSSGDAPSAGGVDSVTGNLVTGTATNPKINLVGTSRDILTFDSDGKPVCKPAGWRQFSDLPMPSTFSNGAIIDGANADAVAGGTPNTMYNYNFDGQRINNGVNKLATNANTNSAGFKALTRNNNTILFMNNDSIGNFTLASTALYNSNQFIMRASTSYSGCTLGMYGLGGYLTQAELNLIKSAYNTYIYS